MSRRGVRRGRVVLLVLITGTVAWWDMRTLLAQGPTDIVAMPGVSALSLSGLAALVGVGVLWGRLTAATKRHESAIDHLLALSQHIVPRPEIDTRLMRIEEKLDRLMERHP